MAEPGDDERLTAEHEPAGVSGGIGMPDSSAEVDAYERWQAETTQRLIELRTGQLAIMQMLERMLPGREA